MPIRPFKFLPRDLVEWGRFFESAHVEPSDESVGADQLQDGSVTYAKLQNVTPDRLLGRDTSPAGVVQEIVVTGGLEFTGSGGIRRSELTGDITAAAGSTTTALRHSAGLSLIGRNAASTGAPGDIVATVADTFMVRRGSALTFDALEDGDIPSTIARDSEVSAAIAALNIASGTYTPTLTSILNLDATTAFQCQYLRVGSVVTVSGRFDANPTAASTVSLGISLPIASDFASTGNAGGTVATQELGGVVAPVFANVANNYAQAQWENTDASSRQYYFTFTYLII